MKNGVTMPEYLLTNAEVEKIKAICLKTLKNPYCPCSFNERIGSFSSALLEEDYDLYKVAPAKELATIFKSVIEEHSYVMGKNEEILKYLT